MDSNASHVDTVRIPSVTGHLRQETVLVTVLLVIQETIVRQVLKSCIWFYGDLLFCTQNNKMCKISQSFLFETNICTVHFLKCCLLYNVSNALSAILLYIFVHSTEVHIHFQFVFYFVLLICFTSYTCQELQWTLKYIFTIYFDLQKLLKVSCGLNISKT